MDIERLFLRFSARYQRAWTSLFPTAQAFEVALSEWALILNGVDADGIERALHRCLTAFPTHPPKPGEFLALTRPTARELGLPSLDEAYRAASAGRWRVHPLVWLIGRTVGFYEFARLNREEAWQRFQGVYRQTVDQVARRRQIDPRFELQIPVAAVPALPPYRTVRISAPGTARVHLAAIRKRLKPPVGH